MKKTKLIMAFLFLYTGIACFGQINYSVSFEKMLDLIFTGVYNVYVRVKSCH